jgi:MFS transporter, DHA1 family, multidrug resistance protein
MKQVSIFVTITLGALTAFGPFLTDFYLPAMPELAEYFRTSPSAVGASLTMSMIGLAGGQILIGPLSDKYGRKGLLVLSMLLFCVSSVLCLFAPSIEAFNLMRLFQGVAGAGGVVLSKSIATDMFTGEYLAKFLALLGAINGIAPITAPIIGGAMTNFTSWRGIFCVLLAIGVVLLYCTTRLKETLPVQMRMKGSLLSAYTKLFSVFKNPLFTLSTVAMMCGFFTFFAYISSSPFVFQHKYGLSALEYSVCFGLNAFFIAVGAMLSSKFHHYNTALKWGAIHFAVAALLVAVGQFLIVPLPVLMAGYIYMMTAFGVMQPVSMAIAMDSERKNAGSASAIFGASSFVAGAIVSPIVTIGNVMHMSAVVIFVGALLCLLFTLPLCSVVKKQKMGKA